MNADASATWTPIIPTLDYCICWTRQHPQNPLMKDEYTIGLFSSRSLAEEALIQLCKNPTLCGARIKSQKPV